MRVWTGWDRLGQASEKGEGSGTGLGKVAVGTPAALLVLSPFAGSGAQHLGVSETGLAGKKRNDGVFHTQL